jgi:hypothetical protein
MPEEAGLFPPLFLLISYFMHSIPRAMGPDPDHMHENAFFGLPEVWSQPFPIVRRFLATVPDRLLTDRCHIVNVAN